MSARTKLAVGLFATSALVSPAYGQDAASNAIPGEQVAAESAAAPGEEGDEIVVTGIRASQQAAVGIKRNEVSIVDAISAEDIGRLPDVTIVDALQRIPGIQIQRTAGEGTTVNIRGLPQVVTLLNGEQYLSAGNLGSAQPNLNDVPAQLMNAVVVYKSVDVRNAMSGISGTIDLRTRRPFDLPKGFTFSGTGEYSTGVDTRENDYLFNGLVNYRADRIGVMASAVYSNANLGNNYAGMSGSAFGNNDWGGGGQNWIAPHGYDSFRREVERNRLGVNAAFQVDLGEGFTATAEVFHTRLTEHNRAAGLNISNRWQGLGWTDPTVFQDTGIAGSNGQPWLDVDEYDLDVWWMNSFSVNRTTKSRSTNYNLELDYDEDGPFTFSARAMRSDSRMLSMNGQVQGDMSNWRRGNTFTLFRDAVDPTRGTFYPAEIAALYPGRYTNNVIGSNGGRYVDPNPRGYGENPQVHLDISRNLSMWSGFDQQLAGGLGAGATTRDYMANLDSYAVGAFSSEGNQRNTSDLGVFRFDGSYDFDAEPFAGFITRIDAGVRRSDRDVEITAFHLFSNFYAGKATDAAGCAAQWKAIDVVMNQNQCQAGEMVSNPAYNPALPTSATNQPTVFQGYTVNRPTRLDQYNNVYFLENYGGVTKGLPGVWVADPRDFDNVRAFHERVFGGATEVIIPGRAYDVGLTEQSGYLNGAFRFGIVSGEVGVRVIETTLNVRQNITGDTLNYGDTNIDAGDTNTRRSYVDILPALNLSFDFTPKLRGRAAIAKTMIPLDLGNYGGGLTISTADSPCNTTPGPTDAPCGVRQVTSASSSGNPMLNPWRSTNYDLALEYYLGRATLFNVSLFRLDISSFVTQGQTTGRFPDQDGVIRRDVPVFLPTQGKGGTLQGVELGARVAFSDLLGGGNILSNFGIEANYTLSDSSQETRGINGDRLPFQDNSRHQANLVAWYQDDRFQARIAYNYRTPRLSGSFTTGGQVIPIYQAAADYVDINLTYSLNDQFSVYLNGSNVLGEIERYYYEFSPDHRQYHSQNEFEPRYSAGVRVRF
ncbi:MAG TPA: TonB-dependent receptor [Allosphingosinicella sp.]|jgi:TonB-dependent receptor